MFMTNTDRVRAELENRLVSGVLPPGSTLDESQLCKEFDVSRTPVREALLQLGADGFVHILPRAGIYVIEMNAAELVEMLEALAYAEGLCAKLACKRISVGQLKKLGQIQEDGRQIVARSDAHAYAQYNLQFHDGIYLASGNTYMREQVLRLRKRINPYWGCLPDALGNSRDASWQEHQELLDALLAGDALAAMDIAASHIRNATRGFAEIAEMQPGHMYFNPDAHRRLPRMTKNTASLRAPMSFAQVAVQPMAG